MPETLYSLTLVKSYSGLQVAAVPLRSSPQGYRSCVGMLTIICADTYARWGGVLKQLLLNKSSIVGRNKTI